MITGMLAAVLLLLSSAGALQQAQTGTLKGKVLDSARAPVTRADVSVRAAGSPERRVSVGADGQFSTILQAGSYKVCVRSQGFEETCKDLNIHARSDTLWEAILRPDYSRMGGDPYIEAFSGEVPTIVSNIPPAALQIPDVRVRVSQGVMDLLALKKILPQPPWSQEKGHEKGVVTVAVLVDYDGTVKNTSLLSGDPVLGEVAMGAIKQWVFRPYVINGQCVQVESRVVMNFGKKRASLVRSHR